MRAKDDNERGDYLVLSRVKMTALAIIPKLVDVASFREKINFFFIVV